MSDVLLSMKLSCESLSAPVVHADKATFTKISLSSPERRQSGARRGEILQICCSLKRCPCRAESIQEEQSRKNGRSTTMKQRHHFTRPK